MEDDLWWKQPSVEDIIWGKTAFGGRQPLMEDNLLWKMTFGGRQPLVEDNLKLMTTFGGRRSLVEDHLQWKMTFGGDSSLDSHSRTKPKLKPEIEFTIIKRCMQHCACTRVQKQRHFRQRQLNHYNIGVGRGEDNWTHHASLI